ncbi:MAG: LysR family transcriptional regulator [Xenococcaceae cyanobacterium]
MAQRLINKLMSTIDPYKLKISQLRILVAVADYRNFSEAALPLNISQSAVSHAIATLETELGVILFNRGRNGAYLTHVGERLVIPAKEILDLLQKIANEANRAKGLEGGNVRIVAFRSAATHILPVLMAQFRRQFPLIKVSVTEVDEHFEIESTLRSSKADIGIVDLPCSDELETWEIYRDEYVVLLPRSLELDQTKLTCQQLGTYPLILSASNTCSLQIRRYLQSLETLVNIDIAYEMKKDSTMIGMAIQGLGAAIMPKLAAEPIPPQLRVYSLPVPLERIIKAAVVKNALHTPAVFAFLDILKNYQSSHSELRFENS